MGAALVGLGMSAAVTGVLVEGSKSSASSPINAASCSSAANFTKPPEMGDGSWVGSGDDGGTDEAMIEEVTFQRQGHKLVSNRARTSSG
jgi:hypothetical protein